MPQSPLLTSSMTTQVTPRMFSPSISTIVSVSFSIISCFCSSSKTPSMSLTFTIGIGEHLLSDSWSFDRPNFMVRFRRCQARPPTDGPSAGQATRDRIVDAARDVLVEHGHGGTSTRAVAERAGVRLSLVHYHFGGKQGLLVEVLERENEQLLERQRELYAAPGPLAEKWRVACDLLDEDLGSGYVRVLWELWAAGLADPELAAGWRAAMAGWRDLITSVFEAWVGGARPRAPAAARARSRRWSPTSSRGSRSSCSPASTRTTRRTARSSTPSAP